MLRPLCLLVLLYSVWWNEMCRKTPWLDDNLVVRARFPHPLIQGGERQSYRQRVFIYKPRLRHSDQPYGWRNPSILVYSENRITAALRAGYFHSSWWMVREKDHPWWFPLKIATVFQRELFSPKGKHVNSRRRKPAEKVMQEYSTLKGLHNVFLDNRMTVLTQVGIIILGCIYPRKRPSMMVYLNPKS